MCLACSPRPHGSAPASCRWPRRTPEQIHAAERLLEQTGRRLYQILADEADDADGEQDEP